MGRPLKPQTILSEISQSKNHKTPKERKKFSKEGVNRRFTQHRHGCLIVETEDKVLGLTGLKKVVSQVLWLTPVILAAWEAEIRKIVVQIQSRQLDLFYLNKTHHKKGLVEWFKV
jgi:hypothetical protein